MYNDMICREAGEEILTPLDVFNPSKSEIDDAWEEYKEGRRELVEDIALRFFQPEVIQNWDDREWEDFEERMRLV